MYHTFRYEYWRDLFGFPDLLLGDGNIIFEQTGINFGGNIPEVLSSSNLENNIAIDYSIGVFGNKINISLYRIEEVETLYMGFFTSLVENTEGFYPEKIPEGVFISRKGILKFYRIYTIYELNNSYTGLVFNSNPKYLLKELPNLDIKLSEFNIDSIALITSMFKFDFSFNGVSRINIHNAIMSIFRNPGEPNSLVPPIVT